MSNKNWLIEMSEKLRISRIVFGDVWERFAELSELNGLLNNQADDMSHSLSPLGDDVLGMIVTSPDEFIVQLRARSSDYDKALADMLEKSPLFWKAYEELKAGL
ncbi:hypothetical protein N9137_00755 [Pseudomonadales bacterium]|nr:hypothetical protein [Pseudomonadales bacterium]